MNRALVLGLLILSVVAPMAAQTDVRLDNTESVVVSLEAQPAKTLQAFPVSWVVRLTNTGDAAAAVGTIVNLGTVADDGRITFNRWSTKIGGEESSIELGPNETKTFAITPASVGTESRFLRPDALSEVGEHHVVAKLSADDLVEEGSLISNEAILRVEEPNGIDGEVLELVRSRYSADLKGLQWGRLPAALKTEIDTKYPTSMYTQLIAVFMGPATLDREIELNHESAYLPALKLQRAKQLVEAGTRAVVNGGHGKGDYDFDRADVLLRDLDSEAWDRVLTEKIAHLRQAIHNQRTTQLDHDQER